MTKKDIEKEQIALTKAIITSMGVIIVGFIIIFILIAVIFNNN